MKKMSRERKQNNCLQLNNNGSAIVVVIIAMAFIGILVSVLMYTALLNYHMKANNLKAKDNFYTAETAFDEIRMGVQGEVSGAISSTYQNILSDFDQASSEDKTFRMRYGFLNQIQKDYMANGNMGTFNLETLYGYLYSTKKGTVLSTTYRDPAGTVTVYSIENTVVDGADVTVKKKNGTVIADATEPVYGSMLLYENKLVLKDITVTYTDEKGYVSIITTDLKISVPDMSFAEAVSLPPLTGYSLIAQKHVLVHPGISTADTSNNTISGSFYCGGLEVGSVSGPTNLMPGCVSLELKEDATDYNSDKRMIVDGEIVVGEKSKLSTDSYGELWTGAISMNGSGSETDTSKYSSVTFNGNSVYVADDMQISGNGNKFTAGGDEAGNNKGQYIGFGTQGGAENSSAIIVNGINTEIDVSKLTNLTLAGNAYVGIGGNDYLGQSASDIVMGQSIAVKSDQVAYLVPAECIGINKESGKQVAEGITNPMTLDMYHDHIQGKSDVYEVSDNIKCTALDGKKLSDFGIITTNPDKKAMYQRYVKQINSSLSLVYYYVMFDSSDSTSVQNASKYFETYYNNNKSTMDAYNKLYTTGIIMRGDSDGFYTLHLAGNVVRYEAADKLSLKKSTLESDSGNAGYTGLLTTSQSKYLALCKKLLESYDQLSPSEKLESANAYINLVKESEITAFFVEAGKDASIHSAAEAGTFSMGTYVARIVDGDYTYTGTGTDNFKGIIIATGNVKVNANFEGIIISGGDITLDRNVSVKPNKEAVIQAMSASKMVNGRNYSVSEFLVGGSGYLGAAKKTYAEGSIDLGDLVGYENWEKQ